MYLSKRGLAACAVVIVSAIILGGWLLRRSPPPSPGSTAANDIPVVITTNGGLLEVATIRHRRSFNLTEAATVLGYTVPFCKETATYVVDAAITYRVRLAKRWVGDYSDGTLHLSVPPPKPSIPVAFDTSRLRATLDSCWFAPSLGAKDDLLRSISGQLAQDANGPGYRSLARGEKARATVRQFAQKWILSQKRYDLPADTPIAVTFTDE
jgi:hypothetical protein